MKTKIYLFSILLFSSLLMLSCVSAEMPLSSKNSILSFTITKGELSKQFDVLENSISGSVDSSFDLNDINIIVGLPDGATISPDLSTIKAITGPFTLKVTAQNGDIKTYNVSINRELSTGNSILEFNINNQNFLAGATINEQTGEITKRVPEFVDLKNLNVALKFSERATISPDPKTITDYSSPVNFTVKSESGVEKAYQVKLESMNVDRARSCSEANAWKWFGGDNRTNVPDLLPYDRNVGTGQTIIVDKDLVPSVFKISFREGFMYFDTYAPYTKSVNLKLIIRDQNLNVITTTTTSVPEQFTGGLVSFDLQKLNLFLEAGKTYVFQWYLVDGTALGITATSAGDTSDGTGFCFNSGYDGQSKISENTSLEDESSWYKHEWHFNIELEGKE